MVFLKYVLVGIWPKMVDSMHVMTLKYKKVLFEYIFVGILPNNDLFYTFKYTFKSKKYYKYNLVYKWLILCM